MNSPIPPEWEAFVQCGNNLMRTDDTIYHDVQLSFLGEKFPVWELALVYTTYVRCVGSGECSLCDGNGEYHVFRPSGACQRVCHDCITSIVETKKFRARKVTFVYDCEYLFDHRWNCYRRVLLREISSGLQLVLHDKVNCSLCGFTPIKYNICRRCHIVVVRFMVKKVILLKDQLIDDILVNIVRSIAG